MHMRTISRAAIVVFLAASLLYACPFIPGGSGVSDWQPLRVGAGGWVTGIDIAADGTKVARTDTYGAYRWTGSEWRQLVTHASLPAGENGADNNYGVFEIRISASSPAPGVPHRLYMMYGGNVYRSDNLGDSWTRTAFPHKTPWNIADANGEYRTMGPKMAIDPADPNVLYVGVADIGTGTSLYAGTNGGDAWNQVPTDQVPPSVVRYDPLDPDHTPIPTGGITGLAFDPASGRNPAGRTNTIYAGSWGNGVYRSTDAGASWSRTTATGGPTEVHHGVVINRVYYAVDGDTDPTSDNEPHYLWRFNGASWTASLLPNRDWHGIAADPGTPGRIVLCGTGGELTQSMDGGDTWGIVTEPARAASDIPWLAWTNEGWMSAGDIAFDPTAPHTLYFAEGIGVWRTTDSLTASPLTWHSQSRGIEQLCANQVLVPPYTGAKPIVFSWDRPVFFLEDNGSYPSAHGPDNEFSIVMGWAADYSYDDPRYLAAVMNYWEREKSGFSTDGGRTWRPFPAYPPTRANNPDDLQAKIGGCIAVGHAQTADPTPIANIVWVPSNDGVPYFTTDGGGTWNRCRFPTPVPPASGWHHNFVWDREIVAADRGAPGTFYIYNSDAPGLYVSTDYGATFNPVYGRISDWADYHVKLRSVPGRAGHLFFTIGQQGNPGDANPAETALMRSVNGGARWDSLPNVREVYDIGFGRAAVDGGYPAIYIAGWVDGEWGIWYSTDEGAAWQTAGDFPLESIDQIRSVTGDPNIFGRVYVGFAGSGYAYRDVPVRP